MIGIMGFLSKLSILTQALSVGIGQTIYTFAVELF